MTFPEAQEYIASFFNFELSPVPYLNRSVFKLERVRRLLALLGDPQNHLKVIHVAGSKGKGSVCALTAAILQKAGYKVGLYTSPHLNHYRERIRVLDAVVPPPSAEEDIFPDMISEADLCRMLDVLKPAIERLQADQELGQLSFFELFTVLAFYYFYQERVDWAVMETGMGGRLDATNVASSSVCAITSLSLEHTSVLGNTLARIAREKAGIIKDRHQRVVVAPQEKEAQEVLRGRCAEFSIGPLWAGRDIQWEIISQDLDHQTISFRSAKHYYPDVELSLAGRHQAINAAVAVGIVESLRESGTVIADEAVRDGLRHAFWPGRMEIMGKDPVVVLDCAHNQASALSLVESLQTYFPHKAVALVLGISQDKDKSGICRELNRSASRVIATKADHPRAYVFQEDELKTLFPDKPCIRTSNVQQALDYVDHHVPKGEIVLIAGSIFLVGEARRHLSVKKVAEGQGARNKEQEKNPGPLTLAT